jgi:hypothetical protein
VLTLSHTVLQLGGKITPGTPKTEGSARKIFLDAVTAELLRQHRKAQLAARLLAGAAWQDNDLIFCRDDGSPWPPDYVLRRFKRIAKDAGLPVLTVHQGGWHTGNSLMRDAGVDDTVRMREVGHTTKTVSDRYTHTLDEQHSPGRRGHRRPGRRSGPLNAPRVPGVPRMFPGGALPERSTTASGTVVRVFAQAGRAEGVGFEPTRTRQRPSGFQDRARSGPA